MGYGLDLTKFVLTLDRFYKQEDVSQVNILSIFHFRTPREAIKNTD